MSIPTTTITEETKRFLRAIDPEASVAVREQEDGSVWVAAEMKEPRLFIGERGQTLTEIQHLLRVILKKKTGEMVPVYLDINRYREHREQYLRELANTTADEVALLKQEKELPPMPPVERRVIHTTLADRQDVASESVGEGPERRVVIKTASS